MQPTDDMLIAAMARVAVDAENLWARDFARSIRRQATGRDSWRWAPSPKQRGIMRRLHAELVAHDGDDFGPLVEIGGKA